MNIGLESELLLRETGFLLGWGANIILGLLFGIGFVFLFGPSAFSGSKAWQRQSFGLVSVLVPWLVFHQFFGWCIAVSKAPEPWNILLRGVITHTVFRLALSLSALMLSQYFRKQRAF